MTQMAISMLVDLGLDDDPTDILDARADLYLTTDGLRLQDDTSVRISTEARRASLGCYYFSSMYVSITSSIT
jgi:hypothetical protein